MSPCVYKSTSEFAFNVIKPFCVIIKEGWRSIVIFNTSWSSFLWWVTRRLSITTPWLATLVWQLSERCNAFTSLLIVKPLKSIVPKLIVLVFNPENTVSSEDTTPTTRKLVSVDVNIGKSKYILLSTLANVIVLLAVASVLPSLNVLLTITSALFVVATPLSR